MLLKTAFYCKFRMDKRESSFASSKPGVAYLIR